MSVVNAKGHVYSFEFENGQKETLVGAIKLEGNADYNDTSEYILNNTPLGSFSGSAICYELNGANSQKRVNLAKTTAIAPENKVLAGTYDTSLQQFTAN